LILPKTFANEPDIPPPLKQMKLGIKLAHIICDEDKIPIWNVHFKPACVYPESEMKLITRGWAKLRLMLPASGDPIKELEWTGKNELSMRFVGTYSIGDEQPLSYDQKRKIAWEYVQEYHQGERLLEYSIYPHQYYYYQGEKIQFDLLEWGNYSECWNLNLRIFDNHNQVLHEETLNDVCLEPDGKPGTFNSYSIGKDSELVCEKPGYYLIEVSNGEIFPPTILQNFVCLDTEPEPEPIISKVIDPTKIVNASNQFALDFYSQVTADKEENVFFSPWSITNAFAIAYEGARGNTADEMSDAFGFVKDDEERRNAFASIHEDLNQKDAKYKLNTANALWIKEGYEIKQDYINTAKVYYDSKVDNVDFVTDEGVNIINEWVKSKTNNKIEDLLAKDSTDELTRLVITNAIYFKGEWMYPFSPDWTRQSDFHINKDKTVTVSMMDLDDRKLNYAQNELLEILELPYKGEKISMLILLPKEIEGLKSVEENLTVEKLSQWRENLSETQIAVLLPKFTAETKYDLKVNLQNMGMKMPFDTFNADFSGINETEQLYIDQAVHKAFVNVYELGTEAAAATGIEVRATSGPPATFRADHPFIYLIQDNETGNILFVGRVIDPTQ